MLDKRVEDLTLRDSLILNGYVFAAFAAAGGAAFAAARFRKHLASKRDAAQKLSDLGSRVVELELELQAAKRKKGFFR